MIFYPIYIYLHNCNAKIASPWIGKSILFYPIHAWHIGKSLPNMTRSLSFNICIISPIDMDDCEACSYPAQYSQLKRWHCHSWHMGKSTQSETHCAKTLCKGGVETLVELEICALWRQRVLPPAAFGPFIKTHSTYPDLHYYPAGTKKRITYCASPGRSLLQGPS